jgi:myo-inositol catabolism protein IolS
VNSGGDGGLDSGRLAFGCCPLGGHGWSAVDVQEVQQAIRLAFDQGITTFDTADVYGFGLSEARLADALAGRRHEARIVTKVGLRWNDHGLVVRDGSPEYLRRAVDDSLRRLGLEAVPVVLLHWPDPQVPLAESLGVLRQLQREGKLFSYGASNLSSEDGPAPPWSQHRVSLLTGALIPELRGTEAAMAWGTLEQGLLAGERRSRDELDPADRRQRLPLWQPSQREAIAPLLNAIRQSAGQLGTTAMALAVRWVLANGGIDAVTVGCKSRDQVKSLLLGAGNPISPVQFELLTHAANRARAALTDFTS